MPADCNSFLKELKDSGELSPEELENVERIWGKSRKFNEGFLAQSEFDRRMNEGKAKVAETEAALEQKRAELDAEVAALATWKTDADGKLKTNIEAFQKAEQDALKARQALAKAAAERGFEAKDYFGEEPTTTERPRTDQPRTEDGKFVDRDTMGKGFLDTIRTNAVLLDLDREHQKLFGEPLKAADLVARAEAASRQANRSVTLVEIWERDFKVPEKRAALAQAEVDRRIKEASDAAYEKGKTDAALGGGQAYGDGKPERGSPVLRQTDRSGKTAVDRTMGNHAAARPGVAAAVAHARQLEREGKPFTTPGSFVG